MRVIAGLWRGFKLNGGKTDLVRPLTDRIKESVFGILGDRVVDARVLDLFAGSGSFGIEALSRGAAHVTFCEKIPTVANQTKKNLEKVRCETERFQILVKDVFKCLQYFHIGNLKFDILFVDPPFREHQNKKFLMSLSEFDILHRKGILIYRHHKSEIAEEKAGRFEVYRCKKYGDSVVKFYRKILFDENSYLPGNI